MALSRPDLLGSAMLLWAAAGLLALYLLCNPGAASLQQGLGPARLWGAVLGLATLGVALPGRRPALWALPLAVLPLLLLPPLWAGLVGPAVLAAAVLFAALGHSPHRCPAYRRRQASPGRIGDSERAAFACSRGIQGGRVRGRRAGRPARTQPTWPPRRLSARTGRRKGVPFRGRSHFPGDGPKRRRRRNASPERRER